MIISRLNFIRFLGFMIVLLFLFLGSALNQYHLSKIIQSNWYPEVQTVSSQMVNTIQLNTSVLEWGNHSPHLMDLLKNQLGFETHQISLTSIHIGKLGFISFLNPPWSLSLSFTQTHLPNYYFFNNNGNPSSLIASNLQNTYFKYFIPIIIQNKVVGDFYLIANNSPVSFGLWSEYNLPLYLDIFLILIILYYMVFHLKSPRLINDNAISFLTLADTMPAIKKQNLSITTSFQASNNSRPTVELLIQDIIYHASTAVIHFDLNGSIQFFNPSAATRLGITQNDDDILSLCDLVKELHISKENIRSLINELNKNGFLYNQTIKFRNKKTNENRMALLSVIEFSDRSKLAGYWVFAEDITDMGAYNINNIPYIDRLNLIAEFAASTAHEIRNPLTTVRGFLQLQKKRETNKRNESHYRVMIDEIDRVDQLISEYLILAKNSSKHNHEETSISNLITNLIPLITAEANMKQVEVFFSNLPTCTCMANVNELKQVFLNICKNALDAMENGGVLSIEGIEHQDSFTIMIKDTGAGMSKEVMDHIFDPFFTTKQKGSGIGLSVSMQIIKSHQGSITAESKLGVGTTFTITLPIIEQQRMYTS